MFRRVLAWVRFGDRGIRARNSSASRHRWAVAKGTRYHYRDVCEKRGFDRELNCFVRSYGSKSLGASILMASSVELLPPMDPRVRGTLDTIQMVHDARRLCAAARSHAKSQGRRNRSKGAFCTLHALQPRDAAFKRSRAEDSRRRNAV
jgi:hypothetical protein